MCIAQGKLNSTYCLSAIKDERWSNLPLIFQEIWAILKIVFTAVTITTSLKT